MINDLLLIVTIAGQPLALRAADVQSVIEVGALTPVPRAPAHVAGLSALRSRVLTAIDCRRCLGLADDDAPPAPAAYAAVVEHDGHSYALLVEGVEDVAQALSEVEAVRAPLGHGWAAMTQGMAETDAGPMLIMDTAAMITGPEDARVAV